jgi:hypothetical protein
VTALLPESAIDWTAFHDPAAAAAQAPTAEEMAEERDERDRAAWQRGQDVEPPTLRADEDAPDPRDEPDFEAGDADAERIAALEEPLPILTAAGPVAPAERNDLPFRTAADLAEFGTPTVRWIAALIVAVGAITELAGKVKLSGKTIFVLALIRAVLDGEPFLGRSTMRTPVVLLTEQPPASFLEALRRADLLERADLTILFWGEAIGVPWSEVVTQAIDECRTRGAQLLAVDTLGHWAGVRGDAENDSGAAMAAIEPLQAAAAEGLAVLVARPDRKGPGQLGESARGSSAFSGAVDIVLHLRRPESQSRPNVRVLEGLSRFDVLEEILIELGDDGVYRVLGDAAAVEASETRQELLDILPMSPDDGLTMADLGARLDDRKRTTIQGALKALAAEGTVERTGSGRKGSPYGWRLAEILSAGTTPLRGEYPKTGQGPSVAPALPEGPGAHILSAGAPSRRGEAETNVDLAAEAQTVLSDMLEGGAA